MSDRTWILADGVSPTTQIRYKPRTPAASDTFMFLYQVLGCVTLYGRICGDRRGLSFRERYNGRLIVINGRPQGSRGILRHPFHVYGEFEEALEAFGLLEACCLRYSPTLTKLRHQIRLGNERR